jgi:hypothetical protein
MSTTSNTAPTPSSMDLRETARRLAMLEAEGIYSEDDARAVANVATWLHSIAAAQDEVEVRMIIASMRGHAA